MEHLIWVVVGWLLVLTIWVVGRLRRIFQELEAERGFRRAADDSNSAWSGFTRRQVNDLMDVLGYEYKHQRESVLIKKK